MEGGRGERRVCNVCEKQRSMQRVGAVRRLTSTYCLLLLFLLEV